MANNEPTFTVGVATTPPAGLTIGRIQNQEFKIWIQSNQAFRMEDAEVDLKIKLDAGVGAEVGDLFASLDGARPTVGKEAGKNAWESKRGTSPDGRNVTWVFTAQSPLVLESDKPQDVATFKGFTCSSTTGAAKITVTRTFGTGSPQSEEFPIIKKEPDQETGPAVLAFNVKPYILWLNSKPRVKWDVKQQNLDPKHLHLVTDSDAHIALPSLKGETEIRITESVKLQFQPKPGTPPALLAELKLIKVAPGFHFLQPEDVSLDGSPKLVFHNLIKGGDGTSLYAIAGPPGGRTPTLYRCGDTIKDWTPEIEDPNKRLPEKFASSPAVWFDNKIWLLGGSSYDTGHVSADVWVGKQATESPWHWSWTLAVPRPPWAPRMGHSALIFNGRLWVVGGRDAEGNPLKDAYVYEAPAWTLVTAGGWHGGCLFGAAEHDANLYVYGGTKAPLSTIVYNDTWIMDQSRKWQQVKIEGVVGQPIASCLAEVGNVLHLLAICPDSKQNGFYQLSFEGRAFGEWIQLKDNPLPEMKRTQAFRLVAVEHEGLFVALDLGMIRAAGGEQGGLYVYIPDR